MFRKRKDKDWLLIFMDSLTGRVLWFKFIESERKIHYLEGLNFLLEKGFEILSVTIDGRPGIADVFKAYPIQICQFHQKQTINRYITTNPKLIPSRQLQTIMETLPRTNRCNFETRFNYWLEVNQNFINEKTINPETNRYRYTHQKLRSAVKSIQRNFPYLFTWQEKINSELLTAYLKNNQRIYNTLTNIPNTTNHLDGGVNPKVKDLVYLHRGMRIDRRNKLISVLLLNLGDRNSN